MPLRVQNRRALRPTTRSAREVRQAQRVLRGDAMCPSDCLDWRRRRAGLYPARPHPAPADLPVVSVRHCVQAPAVAFDVIVERGVGSQRGDDGISGL